MQERSVECGQTSQSKESLFKMAQKVFEYSSKQLEKNNAVNSRTSTAKSQNIFKKKEKHYSIPLLLHKICLKVIRF